MRRPAALGLVGWTLFVWATRIANVWRDEALDTGEKWGRTALATSFTFLAVAVLVALVVRSGRAIRATVAVLAGWTVVVWVVRDMRIALAAPALGFTVVHVVLGVVSIVLAVLAWREEKRLAASATPAVPAGRAP